MFRSHTALPVAHRAVRAGIAVGLLAGFACAYPTERGGEVTVELLDIPPLIEGELVSLAANVTSTVTGEPVPNAVVRFASDNPLVAIVSPEGQLLATGVGQVEITATALGVAGATPSTRTLRIHGALEIDSITPRQVRYGELINVYGAGLMPDSLIAVLVGGAETVVEDYTPSDPNEPHRFGLLRLWAKHPAPLQSIVQILGFNGLAQSPDTTIVIRFDVYEPNDTMPRDFGPLQGSVGNPALAFERKLRDDSIGVDWFRFTQTTRGDRSFIVRPDGIGSAGFQVYVTNDISWTGFANGFQFGSQAWVVSPSVQFCEGIPFGPERFPDDSVVVALRDLAPGQYNLFTVFNRPAAYGMGILANYRSQLPPDAAEENDHCGVASPLTIGATRNYTIDNPHDVDWFSATFTDTTNLTLDVQAADPEADLDLYIIRSFLPDSLQLHGLGNSSGMNEDAQGRVPPGDYFLVVVDFQGRPTAYTIRGDNVASLPDHPNVDVITTFKKSDRSAFEFEH